MEDVKMFEVAYETTFCATHRLTREGQPIEPNHGHDWRVEAVAAGKDLDGLGVVVDFEHLKKVVGEVAASFHYRDMNEHPAWPGSARRRKWWRGISSTRSARAWARRAGCCGACGCGKRPAAPPSYAE
jgi:6-pyruvoyl-tetrahydropterin synthase